MHVIFLTRRAWPHVGGVERHISGVVNEIKKIDKSIKITIITERYDDSLPVEEEVGGVQYYRHRPGDLRSFGQLLQSADIIHVHDVFFWLFSYPEILLKKRVFMTFHGYEPPGPPTWKQRLMHQIAEYGSEASICIGGFHQRWYGVTPTVTSYGAVDAVSVEKVPRVSQKKTRAVFVGRLESDTGIWAYLTAMASKKRSSGISSLHLDVVGDGSQRVLLEQYADDEKIEVHFLGQKNVTPSTYLDYDLSCVSGYLAILESMSVGVPVVATYHSKLKRDYLTCTPFAHWIKIVAPGEDLEMQLFGGERALLPEAISWARHQSWTALAQAYLQIWSQR